MGFWGRFLIFFPQLNRFIAFSSNHSEWRFIKHDLIYACLTRKWAWLYSSLDLLKVIATCPIKKVQRTIISSTNQNIISVQSNRVNHSVMVINSSKLVSIRKLPNPNLVRPTRSKCILIMMDCNTPDSLFMMS